MAKEGIPGPQAKREMLHSEREVDCRKYGDMFFAEKKYNDALDFYAKGELKDELRKLKQVAIEEGDYFILKRLRKFLPDEVTEADWEKLALAAERKGQANFAKWADEERGKRGAIEADTRGEES